MMTHVNIPEAKTIAAHASWSSALPILLLEGTGRMDPISNRYYQEQLSMSSPQAPQMVRIQARQQNPGWHPIPALRVAKHKRFYRYNVHLYTPDLLRQGLPMVGFSLFHKQINSLGVTTYDLLHNPQDISLQAHLPFDDDTLAVIKSRMNLLQPEYVLHVPAASTKSMQELIDTYKQDDDGDSMCRLFTHDMQLFFRNDEDDDDAVPRKLCLRDTICTKIMGGKRMFLIPLGCNEQVPRRPRTTKDAVADGILTTLVLKLAEA